MDRQAGMMTTDTLVIGGGLSGLYAAHLLQKQKRRYLLVEARAQLGGRIRPHHGEGFTLDLGPSWFWPESNPRLLRLLEKFNLAHFAQHTSGDVLLERPDGALTRQPHQEVDPRHPRRLVGGTQAVIKALGSDLLPGFVRLPRRVSAISEHSNHLAVTMEGPEDQSHFTAQRIILALPPRVAAASIKFTPELSCEVLAALRNTPTWMAGDAKFFAIYDEPFWRRDGLSGSAFSERGPLSEVHDLSFPDGPAALTGFFVPDRRERLRLGSRLVPACLEQLARYFGEAAAIPRETVVQDWSCEPLLATPDDVPLFAHPQYGLPLFCHSLFQGRLCFAGTEAARDQGGYMEGALEAAEAALGRLLLLDP